MIQQYPSCRGALAASLAAPSLVPAASQIRAMATPEMAEAYASLALVPGKLRAADTEAFPPREWERWGRVAAETGRRNG